MTRLALDPPRVQPPVPSRPFRHVASQDGSTWAEYYREPAGAYLLRFPGLADFRVSTDLDQVTCVPAPGAGEEACRNTFASQVLPAIMDKRGHTVVHASCVEIDGAAVLFLGDSGRGKSTLAASLARAGHRLLSDDGVRVEAADSMLRAHPREASLRLWPDSAAAVLPGAHATAHAGAKSRIAAQGHIEFCERPIAVRAAYFLGDGAAAVPAIVPMTPAESLVAWMGQCYLLDTEDRLALASQFERLSEMSNRLASHRLDYPRRFEALAVVRTAILDHLGRGAIAG